MGFGVIIPVDSSIGMIIGLFGAVLVAILIMSAIGSGVSKVVDATLSTFKKKDLYYHKKNKNHGIAFLCSLLLPFSGILYLKESKESLMLTVVSILWILGCIIGALTINDFYYLHLMAVSFLILWWVISLITLAILVLKYNKFKNSYSSYQTTDLPFIDGNKFLIVIPIILFILLLGSFFMTSNDSSEKIFEGNTYTIGYPPNYAVIKENEDTGSYVISTFQDKNDSSNFIYIEVLDSDLSAKEVAESNLHVNLSYGQVLDRIDGGTTKVDGEEAYIVTDGFDHTMVIFKKEGKLYEIMFERNAQEPEVMNYFLNSFKFK